jgi:predicted transcriptional regulator
MIAMGLTKTEIFTEAQNKLAHIAKVLGHPARIAILEQILQHEGCICNDLVFETGLAQATISQHLKELKSIGIIRGSVSGKRMCYCIDQEKWETVQELLSNFFKNPQNTANCC